LALNDDEFPSPVSVDSMSHKSIIDLAVGDAVAIGLDSVVNPKGAVFEPSSVVVNGDMIARVGIGPAQVLDIMRSASAHGAFTGRVIALSPGIANNPKQMEIVTDQISAIRQGGAKQIVLIGVSKSYNMGEVTGTDLNNQLRKVADDNKVLLYAGL